MSKTNIFRGPALRKALEFESTPVFAYIPNSQTQLSLLFQLGRPDLRDYVYTMDNGGWGPLADSNRKQEGDTGADRTVTFS